MGFIFYCKTVIIYPLGFYWRYIISLNIDVFVLFLLCIMGKGLFFSVPQR